MQYVELTPLIEEANFSSLEKTILMSQYLQRITHPILLILKF